MDDYSMVEIKQIIRSIAISGATHSLSAKGLADDFKKMEGFELPYKRLGFSSVDQFLHTLTDTVIVNGYGPTASVEPVVTESNRHIRDMVQVSKSNVKNRQKQSFNRQGYRETQNNYRPRPHYNNNTNNYRRNNGFSSANRQTTDNNYYDKDEGNRKIYNKEYDFLDTTNSDGHGSDSSDSMPKFKMTEEKKLEQVVAPAVHQTKGPSPEKPRYNDAIPDDTALILLNSLEVPEDAMNYGDAVEEPKIPETVIPKQSVRVFITEVHNPNRMWFHMGENAEKIDELMNEIEAYYGHLSREEWRMKPANAVAGMYCVAKYVGLWHRAKIVTDYSHNKVKVFYIDYGTVAELELKDVKFMAKCFAHMPAQALRASLAFVKPVNHRWTRDASWSLLSLVYEKILYAYVVNVDRQDELMEAVLIDTSGTQDIIINQQLFVKGHAIWEDDMPYKDKNTENYSTRRKAYCELHPRFEELENALYPTLLEIGEFHSQGFNFDSYYAQSLRSDSEYMLHSLKRTFTIQPKLLMKKHKKRNTNRWKSKPVSYQPPLEDYVELNMYQMLSPDEVSLDNGTVDEVSCPDTSELKVQVGEGTKTKRKQVRFMEPEKPLKDDVSQEGTDKTEHCPRLVEEELSLNGAPELLAST